MSGWIKCSERLPGKNIREILVYSKHGNILCVHRDYGGWCLAECEYGKGIYFTGEDVKFDYCMPLPSPPTL